MIEDLLWDDMIEEGYTFPEWATKERLFDLSLLEFQVEFWQNDGNIRDIEEVLALPDGDTKEKRIEKSEAMYSLFLRYGGDPSTYSHDSLGFSYFVGALINEGHYDYDYSYLRAALQRAGLGDGLVVRPEDEEDLLKSYVLNDDQKDACVFVPGNYEALDHFAKTTDLNIVFIGGDLDSWSAVYVDGGDNPNFRSYVLTGKAHSTQISDFDPETQAEIVETLRSWVSKITSDFIAL